MTLCVIHWPAYAAAPEHYELLSEADGQDERGAPIVKMEVLRIERTRAGIEVYLAANYSGCDIPFWEGVSTGKYLKITH